MYSELIKRLREHNDERLYLDADELMAEGADALEAQAKEIAARDLVIQQMREALQLPCDRWNAVQTILVNKALALQQSTSALDAYVADKVKEKESALETERMRLAACSTAALGYFEGCCDEYKSASLDDVLRLRAMFTSQSEALKLAGEALQNCANGEDDVMLTREALAAINALEK